MNRMIARGALVLALLVPALASAGPSCPSMLGNWTFTYACVGHESPPHFETITRPGVVTDQLGCVFMGTLSFLPWVGALTGNGNRTVHSDYDGAKAVGELTLRGGEVVEMTFTYTIGQDGTAPPTACTGTATRG